MLVLRISPDGIWDLQMVGVEETESRKKIRSALSVKAMLRTSSKTTDTFYPMLEVAEKFGQPIWIDSREVCAQVANEAPASAA